MHEPEMEPLKPRPATSETIPRAVEFLINLMVRWICFALAGAFSLLSLVGWLAAWPWWVGLPTLALTLAFFLCAFSIRPRGKIVYGSGGPIVIVPNQNPANRG